MNLKYKNENIRGSFISIYIKIQKWNLFCNQTSQYLDMQDDRSIHGIMYNLTSFNRLVNKSSLDFVGDEECSVFTPGTTLTSKPIGLTGTAELMIPHIAAAAS